MKLLRLIVLVFGIVFLSTHIMAQEPPSRHMLTFEYDGLERFYHLTIPENYDPENPTPLLLALHPIFSSGKAMEALTGLDESGYIVAYPQSYHPIWNDSRMDVGFSIVYDPIVDDLGFLAALVDQILAEYNTTELYVTGMNNGAFMAMYFACSYPERVDALVMVAALLWDYMAEGCGAKTPASFDVLMFHGSQDNYYKPGGDTTSDGSHFYLGREASLAFWADWNDCNEMHVNQHVARYDCAGGITTAMYMISNAGHSWLRIGDYKLNNFGIDITQRMLAFLSGDESWADDPAEVENPAIGRSYHVYVPTTYDLADPEPLPLVMLLHGNPSTGVAMGFITDFNKVAEREGVIAVYPDAINFGGWASSMPDTLEDTSERLNDTRFLLNIIDDLSQHINIDQTRMYVTGFSNGGYMTQRMACVASDRFAAFAYVGASYFDGLEVLCSEKRPVPMLMMHGTLDQSIGWDGSVRDGNGYLAGYTYPVSRTMSFWLYHNQCVNEYERIDIPPETEPADTSVSLFHYTNCEAEFKFYVIVGGGHNWPGVPGIISEQIAGKVNTDINANEVIWEFFSQYSLES